MRFTKLVCHTIPKSSNPNLILVNASIFDFELTLDDLSKIDLINQNQRVGADPNNFDF
jgi:methylglyoxal/glyoxal reductase